MLSRIRCLASTGARTLLPHVQYASSSQQQDTIVTDCVVIGAGVIGLACARALALKGVEVVVVESADAVGTHTSSRNSEVLHAGIYYATGSWKARWCVEGRARLVEYCTQRDVPYWKLGKLIVAATAKQVPKLQRLLDLGRANAAPDLQLISGDEACAMEPALACHAALLSPNTAIIDSHRLMGALQGELEAHGGAVARRSKVTGGQLAAAGGGGGVGRARHRLEVTDQLSGELTVMECRMVVNSAGLFAQEVSRSLAGVQPSSIPTQHLAKGSYFSLAGRAPFQQLIYPVPEDGGMGVHLTLDLAGQARFGPDVEWVDHIDYKVDERRADVFYAAIRTYFPALKDASLMASYAGVRPKLVGPKQPPVDFMVQGSRDHGLPGFVALYGIESPGLTSCLPLADHVASLLLAQSQPQS